MQNDNNSKYVITNGRIFQRVKMGLDETEVLPFIQTLIEQRDELAKRNENSPTMTRFIENIAKEADAWAEQTKKEAREQASAEAKAILLKAEEQAGRYVEEKRLEARELAANESKAIITSAQEQATKYLEEKRKEAVDISTKEAEFIKHQAQIQIESWVKEIKNNLIMQLRGLSGLLNKEMRTQAEDLRRRAVIYESDFEKQLMDIKKQEITINAGISEHNQTKSSAESQCVSGQELPLETENEVPMTLEVSETITEENLKGAKWLAIQVAAGDEDEIKALKSRLDRQSEIGESVINKEIDRTTISVQLRKPIDLISKLMSFPEVKQAQEISQNDQLVYQVVLAKVPTKENMKDTLRERLRNLNLQP